MKLHGGRKTGAVVAGPSGHHQAPGSRGCGLGLIRCHWQALYLGAADIPSCHDIAPDSMPDARDILFRSRRRSPAVISFSHAGDAVCRVMEAELVDVPMSMMLILPARKEFREILDTVLDDPSIAEVDLLGQWSDMTGTMLLMPLRGDDGRIAEILGGLEVRGRPGLKPGRLDILDVRLTPIPEAPRRDPRADLLRLIGKPRPASGHSAPRLRIVPSTDR